MGKKDREIERLRRVNKALVETADEWRQMAYDNNSRRYKLKVENEKLKSEKAQLEKKFATPHNFTMTIEFDLPEFWEVV